MGESENCFLKMDVTILVLLQAFKQTPFEVLHYIDFYLKCFPDGSEDQAGRCGQSDNAGPEPVHVVRPCHGMKMFY